ncbi:MAG: FkbM family methyltransferase [Pseudomonas sp.]
MLLKKFLTGVLGRSNSYRIGRALYMHARGDISNNIFDNGELMVQQSVINALEGKYNNESLIIFDCGANVGDWSLPLLFDKRIKNKINIILHAFEPVPATAQMLRARLQDFPSVNFHKLALSSESGDVSINIVGDGAGTNSLHSESGDSEGDIIVNRITASEFCNANSIEKITLFKCDTEGHDMDVIYGALPLLRQGRISVLQFEYNHRWIFSRHYLKDVFEAISGISYRLGKICSGHIELYDRWYPELDRFFEANYLLIKDEALDWFETVECRPNKHSAVLPVKA